MIQYATTEEARAVATQWGGDPASVAHLGDRGNSVFSFRNGEGQPQILRFTDPAFRTFDEVAAELGFVSLLHAAGVSVARPLASLGGAFVLSHAREGGGLICSSVAYAPGVEVGDGSPDWNRDFFREWGRNLARIHKAAEAIPAGEVRRWRWDEELLFANADRLIPKDDGPSRGELAEPLGACRKLPKTGADFGLIHADHAPQNFRYVPALKRLTAFDFGNCCYHWYAADLAISLSTVRRKKNKEEIRDGILDGYASIRPLPPDLDELLELFIRLRVVYVYLSRLHLWAENPTPEQANEVALLKERVHARTGWHT